MYLIAFPLLLIPFALYNIVVFLLQLPPDSPLAIIPLPSVRSVALSIGDVLVVFGAFLIWVETFKPRHSIWAGVNRILSVVLFVAMLVELLFSERAATATFVILVVLSFTDVISGFVIGGFAASISEQSEIILGTGKDDDPY